MSELSPSHPAGTAEVRWSGLTHVGRVRINNEDTFLALAVDSREVRYLGKTGRASLADSDFIFAVSDGMGGERSGEFASRISVDRITRVLPHAIKKAVVGATADPQLLLGELIAAIHGDLMKLGASYEECSGMGATISLGWLRPGWLHFAHVGDSRIYRLPPGGPLQQITEDHSYVGWLRRRGEIAEREARIHPRRNALQQALGAGNQFVAPHLGSVPTEPGDRYLICSDGLVEGLWDGQLADYLGAAGQSVDQPSLAQRLVETAVQNSGRDNTTAVVFEIAPA
ncbi:MAG: protein phosphatase 2C domain-containing protein [Opitutaceae bacterium]